MTHDPFADVLDATRRHRSAHGCGAYAYANGPLLAVIAATARARRIVEVGTALGYSALWLAHGALDATLDTIEADGGHVRLAREQLSRHTAGARVHVHEGRAERVLDALEAQAYDVAFFDGFAPTAVLLHGLRERLRPGGVLIAGNLNFGRGDEVIGSLEDAAQWLTLSLGETAVAVRRERGG